MSPFGRIESMSARDYAGIHGKRKRAHQTYRARHRHSIHAFFSIKSLRQGTVARATTQRALADWALRNPITGIAGCRARAVSGHAAAAPPSPAMNSRRRIGRLPRQADSLSRTRLHVNGLPRTTNGPSPLTTSPGQRSRSRTDQETTAHPRPASLSPRGIREPVCVQSACVALAISVRTPTPHFSIFMLRDAVTFPAHLGDRGQMRGIEDTALVRGGLDFASRPRWRILRGNPSQSPADAIQTYRGLTYPAAASRTAAISRAISAINLLEFEQSSMSSLLPLCRNSPERLK